MPTSNCLFLYYHLLEGVIDYLNITSANNVFHSQKYTCNNLRGRRQIPSTDSHLVYGIEGMGSTVSTIWPFKVHQQEFCYCWIFVIRISVHCKNKYTIGLVRYSHNLLIIQQWVLMVLYLWVGKWKLARMCWTFSCKDIVWKMKCSFILNGPFFPLLPL